jgi:hypothetical protein
VPARISGALSRVQLAAAPAGRGCGTFRAGGGRLSVSLERAPGGASDEVTARLRERIRAAEPVAVCLADCLGAKPWQLRALQQAFTERRLDEREFVTREALVDLVRALDILIPEHVPATHEGWCYLRRAQAHLPHAEWLRDLGAAGLDALAARCGVARFWRPFAGKAGLRRQLAALRDYYDYAALFPDEALLPASHATDLRAVVAACERWQGTVEPEVLRYYHDRAYPPCEVSRGYFWTEAGD